MSRRQPPFEITPDLLLRAYSIGLFPMAEDRDDPELHWVEPERRGVFPLDGLVVSQEPRQDRALRSRSRSPPTAPSRK